MWPRLLPVVAVVALLGVAAALWWRRAPVFVLDTRADRNVLLVTIDTLRADALGTYGGGAATPVIDALAAQGARFDSARAHAVVTLPSHASILTGRYPYEHGIRDNAGYRLGLAQPTLATRLRAQDFDTGAFVGGFPLNRRFGLDAGFDVYDDRVGEVFGRDLTIPERPADAVIAAALEWIGARQRRWFGWVHLFDPHSPYRPPGEWTARYPGQPYLGEVAWTDSALASLIDRLDREPRPTLVVVTADHGESLGEHGELTHSLFAYDATLRVPLVIAEIDPAAAPATAGLAIDTPVRHVDLVPTILDALGIDATDETSGRSLRPLLSDEDDRGDRPSYFEAMTATLTRGWAPLRGVVAGTWKYIDLPIPELYDLGADPGETTNVIGRDGERAAILRRTLATFDTAPPGRPAAETTAVRDRLRALGYAGSTAPPRDRYTEADDPKRLVELEQMMQRATEAWAAGRAGEAMALYRQVLERRPDTEDAWRYLAFVQWESGDPTGAIATLERALGAGLTGEDLRIKLSQYLSEIGEPARALPLLEGVDDANPDAQIARGIAHAGAGRLDRALVAFQAAARLDPASGLARQNIGTIQMRQGDLAAAERSLSESLAIDDGLVGAHTALGVLYARTNRRAQAIERWQRAVALSPAALDALYNLTLALADAGRFDDARRYGDQYLRTAPPALHAQDLERVRRAIGR